MITLLRTSDLSLPYSVRSYIDSCAYEYTEQDAWSKIADIAYRLKRGAHLLPDFIEDINRTWKIWHIVIMNIQPKEA